jgi:hypothetical protein
MLGLTRARQQASCWFQMVFFSGDYIVWVVPLMSPNFLASPDYH